MKPGLVASAANRKIVDSQILQALAKNAVDFSLFQRVAFLREFSHNAASCFRIICAYVPTGGVVSVNFYKFNIAPLVALKFKSPVIHLVLV